MSYLQDLLIFSIVNNFSSIFTQTPSKQLWESIIPVGATFSAPVQIGPGAYPASCTMGTGSFPGLKRPGRGVDHPPPSSAEVKEKVKLYLYSPSRPSWPVRRWTLPYHRLKHNMVWPKYRSTVEHPHVIQKNFRASTKVNVGCGLLYSPVISEYAWVLHLSTVRKRQWPTSVI
jgi:hypothetical protein